MSTGTVPVVTQKKFDWRSLIPIFQLGGDIAEMAIPGGAAFIPLTHSVEAAILPIIQSLGQGKTNVQMEVMAFYGTAIGVLEAMRQTTGVDPALLAKIEGYIAAAQSAMAGWVQAQSGYNPDNYKPVQPI